MAQTIIVDTTPGYRMPTIYYSQGDIGRTFSIDLQSRFGESLPASPTITIQATKPSGLGFSVASTSISGAVVTFTVTETMSNEAGRFPAELKIVKNSVTLFTANFYIDCEANAHPEGTTDGDIEHIMPKFMSVTTTTLSAGDSATYTFDPETNTANFGIPKGADGSLASQVLAADYSSSKTYAVGDYVYYNGNLYRCTTAITTAEAWTSGHWTQVALGDDVSVLKSDLEKTVGVSIIRFSYGGYIKTGYVAIGNPVDLTPIENAQTCYAIVDCSAGDTIILNGNGADSARIWAFIDGDNKLLSVASGPTTASDLKIVAPTNAVKCVINIITNTLGVCILGEYITDRVYANETDITSLKNFDDALLDEHTNNLLALGTLEEKKYYAGNTGAGDSNNAMFSIANIPVKKYRYARMYFYSSDVPASYERNSPRSVVFYKSDGTRSWGLDIYAYSNYFDMGVPVPEDAVTMNVSFMYNGSYPTKPTTYWANTENTLIEYDAINDDYKVNAINIINSEKIARKTNFIRARQPKICFTLDGNYPRTQAIIDIANNHGIKIGLAPKWDDSFADDVGTERAYYPSEKYLEWQSEGHEILSHLSYDMPESTTYTDEQCIEFIKKSYITMVARGYDIKGAIGSSGVVAQRFLPYIKRWYSYGSTRSNHSELEGDRGDLLFATTEPYELWRYSMQLSTLAGMKQAVDDAIANNGLVIFYGHAQSASAIAPKVFEDGDTYGDNPNTAGSTTNLTQTDHFTEANFDALLTYLESKVEEGACEVLPPFEAINDYYKIRKTDI